MPIYEFICNCGHKEDVFVHKIRPSLKQVTCKQCGSEMKKMVSRVNTDMKSNFRWSRSMGVNIGQIEEAERLYPGSHYNRRTGDLAIESRKDKLEKIKQRGMVEIE